MTTAAWAVRDRRIALSAAELDELLELLTRALAAADLGPERRVAVFAENAVETLVVHVAALLAGCSAVPVNGRLTAAEAAYILDDSSARVVFVGPETAERACAAAGREVAVVGWRCPAGGAVVPWTDWAPAGRPDVGPVAPRPPLVYTSGTTGQPKGTELPPRTFPRSPTMGDHLTAVRSGPFARHGPHLVVGPLHHVGPLVPGVRALAGGLPVVILGPFDAEETLVAIDEFDIAATVMVPTHFVRLLGLPSEVRNRYDVSSLRYVLHTGASCPPDVKRRMIDWWGLVLHEVYGATEVGTTCAIDSAAWLAHPGSVGRAVAPFEAVVVDEAGRTLPPNTEGHLYFRDPTGRGVVYHNDPVKSAGAHLAPGVFTLGEVGYVDGDGFVYVTDRFADMVVSGGANVYPAEAEQAILAHPGVADVACIGLPDVEMGERLYALLVPADPAAPPDVDEVIRFCRDRMAHYKCPRGGAVVESVGRTPLGKVNKRALRDWYLRSLAGAAR